MNWTELFIAIVSHVSWPLTVIILAWMFHDALKSVAGRIESDNIKKLEFRLHSQEPFEKNLSRAEGIADALKLPAIPDVKRPKDEFEERVKQIITSAKKQPSAALFDAWDELMRVTGAAIERNTAKQPPPDKIIVEAARVFDQGVVSVITLLMMIVERQKSNPSSTLDNGFALRFINLTSRVSISIIGLNATQPAM